MAKESEKTALFVRIPRGQAEKLDRAAFELKASKQDLIAGLVSRYLPDASAGAGELRKLAPGFTRRETTVAIDDGLTIGRASFRPDEPHEVLTLEQAAGWLQVDEQVLADLAEAGKLPGRKLGGEWRFARQAILSWLARE